MDEISTGSGIFSQARGLFLSYERQVYRGRSAKDPARERITYSLKAPGLGWLLRPLVRRSLRRFPSGNYPIWHPPTTLDWMTLQTIASLFWLSVIVSYFSTLLGQTLAFSSREFHASAAVQGTVLSISRADVIIALPLVALGDRLGRRRIIILATAGASITSFLGAFVPSASLLALDQVVTKGFATAAALLITIMAAESVPARARAHAIGVLTLGAAFGAGICAALVSTAGLSRGSWRLLYGVSILGVLAVTSISRYIPESRRFLISKHTRWTNIFKSHRKRLSLIVIEAILINIFFIPESQFRNSYLTSERGFSAADVSLFTIFTNLPGGIGLAIGGRIAEVRGRKIVAGVGLGLGAGFLGAAFLSSGVWLWIFACLGALFGSASVPALGVFGPELFPTSLRGVATGIALVGGRVSSIVGVLFVGFFARSTEGIGTPIAQLAAAPLLFSVVLLLAFPETKELELEEINPSDQSFGEDLGLQEG